MYQRTLTLSEYPRQRQAARQLRRRANRIANRVERVLLCFCAAAVLYFAIRLLVP